MKPCIWMRTSYRRKPVENCQEINRKLELCILWWAGRDSTYFQSFYSFLWTPMLQKTDKKLNPAHVFIFSFSFLQRKVPQYALVENWKTRLACVAHNMLNIICFQRRTNQFYYIYCIYIYMYICIYIYMALSRLCLSLDIRTARPTNCFL